MRYIKLFEKFVVTDEDVKDYKVGDIVVCVDRTKEKKVFGIEFGKKYKIKNRSQYSVTVTNLKNKDIIDPATSKPRLFYIKNFMKIEDFEDQELAKKYNL